MTKLNKYTPFAIALCLGLSGCELIGPKQHEKIALDPVNMDETADVVYQELSNESNQEVNEQAKVEIYPGSGQFTRGLANRVPAKVSGKGEYSLNFDDADLGEVSKVILTDILSENYVLSPKVAGKVTLQTTQPLTKQELLPMLEMLLQINNAALTFQNGLYQIKPAAEAIASSVFSGTRRPRKSMPAGYQVRVVPVKNVAIAELLEIIKPLLKEKTILHSDNQRNLLMLAGTAVELIRAMDIVNTFDVDVMKGRSFGLFPLQSVEANKMIEELEKLFNGKNKEGSGIVQFMEIERLNAILAITSQAQKLKSVERWILRLDRTNTSAGGGVMVYRAQHVDAVELAATLNEIFSSSGNKNKPASVAAGKKQVEVTNKKTAAGNKTKTKTTVKKGATMSLSDVGDVKIIADEINNALVIVATAQDYALVHRVIKQLDVMPLQVLIDATIVEVTLTDKLSYGIKWFLEHNNGGQNAVNSDGGQFSDAAAAAAAAATGGFSYAFASNSGDISAVLDATASDNKLNVISSPSLMVLNNQEASIQVGDEVPIRTSQSTNLNNSDGIETSSIQQRKTGVKLKVKPRVNASGLVIMEIDQSVENVAETTVSGIDSPTIATREITSSVAVQSGETIVLGGLIKNDDTFNQGGIPVLHTLPLIGPLFGSTTKNNVKTELVVLITPRVIKSRQDARLIADEFKRKLSGIYTESPEPIEAVEQ